MQREGGERETKRRERGTAHSYYPPPSLPPAPCTAIFHSPNPLSLPPRMQIPGLQPKYQNSKCIPNRRRNDPQIHTLGPPSSYQMPPLTGPTTHLVSFKLNPHKSPKLSHPSIFKFTPHLSILTSPVFSFFSI